MEQQLTDYGNYLVSTLSTIEDDSLKDIDMYVIRSVQRENKENYYISLTIRYDSKNYNSKNYKLLLKKIKDIIYKYHICPEDDEEQWIVTTGNNDVDDSVMTQEIYLDCKGKIGEEVPLYIKIHPYKKEYYLKWKDHYEKERKVCRVMERPPIDKKLSLINKLLDNHWTEFNDSYVLK